MQAEARAECPELDRLHAAIIEARDCLPKATSRNSSDDCGYHYRASQAAKAWIAYARQNAKSCGISGNLVQMEWEYRNIARTRDDVCSGRPARPFTAERGIAR